MDSLSTLLDQVDVKRALCTRFELSAPWGHEVSNQSCVKFVLVLNGSCWLRTKSLRDPVRLVPGDLFFVFNGDYYGLSDTPQRKLIDCRVLEKVRDGFLIRYGGSGAATSLISVALDLELESANFLISALPKLILLKVDRSRSFTLRTLIELMENEVKEKDLGSEVLVQRLVEGLFICSLREYAQKLDESEQGLLPALSHPQIGKAVEAMCARPEANWNLENLADAATMSRSAFANKFKRIYGQAPLEFLTRFRMQQSKHFLNAGLSMTEVASKVGYDSDVSYSRAFKRVTGKTPGSFRKESTY